MDILERALKCGYHISDRLFTAILERGNYLPCNWVLSLKILHSNLMAIYNLQSGSCADLSTPLPLSMGHPCAVEVG